MRACSSLLLVYQLIALLTPFQSDVWVREALGHRTSREWSGKRMTGWTQSKNLLLEYQYQLFSIDPLSKANPHLRFDSRRVFKLKPLYLHHLPFVKQELLHLMWLLTWLFQLNSTCKVESIEYLFRVYSKAQLFGVPNHHSVITWRNTWLCLFTLSIPPRTNLEILVVLGWPFTILQASNPTG